MTLIERLPLPVLPFFMAPDIYNEIMQIMIRYAAAVSAADNAALRAELANARATDIHSCHDGCTRSGCVNARLRDENNRLRGEVAGMKRYRLEEAEKADTTISALRNRVARAALKGGL